MPTLVGTNIVNSISRRVILPRIVDTVYNTNALFWRLNAGNKKQIAGGTHVEVPFMYAEFTNGGPYQGYDVLDTAPNDTVKNGGWDIKSHAVPVTVDHQTMIKWNNPDAAANGLNVLWEQARMQMASNLGDGLWSDGVANTKEIFGLKGAVDDGGVATSYAGLTRSSNTWLNSYDDSTTATLTFTALRALVSGCTYGGNTPTVMFGRKEQYNRLHALLWANQRYVEDDKTMTTAGFRNVCWEGIPFVIDDKVPDGPNSSNSMVYALNEDVIELAIFAGGDFDMEDFVRPANQMAMVGFLTWDGELMVLNPKTCGKLSNISA